MTIYRNFYACGACGCEWNDDWDCTCDDRCPVCDVSNSPNYSEDLGEEPILELEGTL